VGGKGKIEGLRRGGTLGSKQKQRKKADSPGEGVGEATREEGNMLWKQIPTAG